MEYLEQNDSPSCTEIDLQSSDDFSLFLSSGTTEMFEDPKLTHSSYDILAPHIDTDDFHFEKTPPQGIIITTGQTPSHFRDFSRKGCTCGKIKCLRDYCSCHKNNKRCSPLECNCSNCENYQREKVMRLKMEDLWSLNSSFSMMGGKVAQRKY